MGPISVSRVFHTCRSIRLQGVSGAFQVVLEAINGCSKKFQGFHEHSRGFQVGLGHSRIVLCISVRKFHWVLNGSPISLEATKKKNKRFIHTSPGTYALSSLKFYECIGVSENS